MGLHQIKHYHLSVFSADMHKMHLSSITITIYFLNSHPTPKRFLRDHQYMTTKHEHSIYIH